MRIGIDARLAANLGGIGRYAFDLVRALGNFGRLDYQVFVKQGQDTTWIPKKMRTIPLVVSPVPILGAHWLAARHIKAAGCDLVHFPHLNVPLGYDGPFIATVHDLSIYQHPEWFAGGQWFSTRVVTPHAAKQATKLIAISDDVGKLATEQFTLLPDQVTVVPNGVDTDIFKPASSARRDYLLFVGSAAPYKNIPLLNAVVKAQTYPCHVVGASAEDFQGVLRDKIAPNFVFHPALPFNDPSLVGLYQHARCLLQPSLYESFALPILEAIACGTPVVAADIPSLRKIYGSAIVYAGLEQSDQWGSAINRVVLSLDAADVVRRNNWRTLTNQLKTLYSQAA
jgi:glycosyltransferase involved in cell wall biosynthesis